MMSRRSFFRWPTFGLMAAAAPAVVVANQERAADGVDERTVALIKQELAKRDAELPAKLARHLRTANARGIF